MAFSNQIGDIFDAVRKQGGFGQRATSDSAEGGSTVRNKDVYINIGNWTFADNPYALAGVGRTMIHELLHVGSGTNLITAIMKCSKRLTLWLKGSGALH